MDEEHGFTDEGCEQEQNADPLGSSGATGYVRFWKIRVKIDNVMHNISVTCLSAWAAFFGFTTDEIVMRWLCGAILMWMAITGLKWEDTKMDKHELNEWPEQPDGDGKKKCPYCGKEIT